MPLSLYDMQHLIISVFNMSQEIDSESAPASYKSNLSAVMFQNQLSFPQSKHYLGTCCGVLCLFLHGAWLAVSLGEVNHKFQLFPCLSSGPLLSCATVRVIVYTHKKRVFVYFYDFLQRTMQRPKIQSQINSFCFVLTLFGNMIPNTVVQCFYSQG